MSRRARIYFSFAFLLSLQIVFANTAAAQELKKVRFGYPSLGFRQGHIWVAKDEGLFKKYGLDVEPIFLRGGQLAIQALAGGDPPLMSIGQVVLALIAGVEIYYDSTVFARPEITRLEQLKGKRLGISGYGAATHFAAIIVANHLNLDPDKDIILVPGGPDAERVAAMSAGKIDAAIFNSSTIPIAKRLGLIELDSKPQGRGAGKQYGHNAQLHQKQS
jgi:ABC-type nitrate/sulfonate/bicarbonate transport system substrate-binding protein